MANKQTLTKAALLVLLGASAFFFYNASKFEMQASKLQNEVVEVKKELANLKTPAGDLKSQIETLEKELATTKSQLADARSQLAASKEELAESRKKANYLQGRLSKSGFGYLPCWIPKEGEPTRYVLKVTVNNPNSVTVVPAWPDDAYKVKAEKVKPFVEMVKRKEMSMTDFLALANEVNNNYVGKGTEDECRYFVILDNNQIKDRKGADLARYRISSLFYIFESR